MKTLTITRGLPASGKTTFARTWLAESPNDGMRVNRDDLRAMLFHKPTYDARQEGLVTRIQRAAVQVGIESGWDVIADDTNIKPSYVKDWWKFARKIGVEYFSTEEFNVDVEECVGRDAVREKRVGEHVIRRMAKSLDKGRLRPFVPPASQPELAIEPYRRPDYWQPKVIIVDIDGTVALNTSGRSPYDMTRVSEDTPNPVVIEAVRAMIRAGHEVIFCSGRNECARADTELWLKEHVTHWWDHLFMRADNDSRKDSVVKLEIFNNYIRHNFDVVAVFDDRNQVVDMWRSLGLTCFQVAPGDF